MTISNIGNTGASNGSDTAAARQSISKTYNVFLEMLTTQLKYQDPLDPMDTDDMTNQLVSFNQVEQAISTNEKLDDLITQGTANQLTEASGLVGLKAEHAGTTIKRQTGYPAGEWSYNLALNSKSTTLDIINESGTVVQSLRGFTSAGWHDVNWDGTDSAGNPVPDGNYTLRINALDESGEPVATSTTVTDVIRTATLDGSKAVLEIGASAVPLTDILAIRQNTNPSNTVPET